MSDNFRAAQRAYDNESDEPTKPRKRTLSEVEAEGAAKRKCRTCGEWKYIGDSRDHICDDCEREFRMSL
jgi:hypothetical protein